MIINEMNRSSGINLTIALTLFLATFLVYGRMLGQQYVNIYDPVYVSQNPYVASGITGATPIWNKAIKWYLDENFSDEDSKLTFDDPENVEKLQVDSLTGMLPYSDDNTSYNQPCFMI